MSRLHANMLLLLAAAFWGFGNVAQKTVLHHLDPMSAVGIRCLLAAVLVAPLIRFDGSSGGRPGRWSSLLTVSALFSIAMAVQQASYLGTSVTNASFLVNTAAVMTPLVAWLMLKERPSTTVALAAGMCLAGVFLLAGGLRGAVTLGDGAALLSAVCYAGWMVALGRHLAVHGRAIETAAAQFFAAGVLALPLGAVFGRLSLAALWHAAPELAILGIFSTAAAFGMQTLAQRYTPASHAAVIVSAESVFGAAGAALLLDERVSLIGALGGLIMLAAIGYLALYDGANISAICFGRARNFNDLDRRLPASSNKRQIWLPVEFSFGPPSPASLTTDTAFTARSSQAALKHT